MSEPVPPPQRQSSRARRPKQRLAEPTSDDDDDDTSFDTPPANTSTKRKSNADNNSSSKSAKTTTTTTHTSITTEQDYNKNEALFKKFNSATSKVTNVGDVGYKFNKGFNGKSFVGYVVEIRPLAEDGNDRRCVYSDGDGEDLSMAELGSLASVNNTDRMSTADPSEPLPSINTTGDKDCIVQRVDNSNKDEAVAMNKDGGSGTEFASNTTEKRSGSIEQRKKGSSNVDTNKGGSITKDSGGSIAKDSDMCVDVDTTDKGGSITKDSGGSIAKDSDMCVDVAGGGKTAELELVFETCLPAPPASSKSRGLTARSEWGEEIKNDVAVRMGLVRLSIDGMRFDCYLCDSTVKARHPYSPDSYLGKGGHRYNDKHKKELAAKLWNTRREKQRFAEGKLPAKANKTMMQSTMMGFYRRGSTSTTTSRPSTSTTSRAAATSTAATWTTASTNTNSAVAGKFSMYLVAVLLFIILKYASNFYTIYLHFSFLGRSTIASIATGCMGVIPLKFCEPVGSDYNLTIVHKYGRLDPKSDYHLKEVGEDTSVYNLYHNNCTGVGIQLDGKRQGGIRCVICMELWTKKSSRIKTRMKSRIDNLKRAESLLLVPNLTQENATSMRDFSRTGAQSLNDNGQQLKEMVKERHQCECMYVCVCMCCLINQ